MSAWDRAGERVERLATVTARELREWLVELKWYRSRVYCDGKFVDKRIADARAECERLVEKWTRLGAEAPGRLVEVDARIAEWTRKLEELEAGGGAGSSREVARAERERRVQELAARAQAGDKAAAAELVAMVMKGGGR